MPRVIITVPDKVPQPYRFQLDRRVVMIGRGSVNDIVVDSASISVKHAEMLRVEGGYELRDQGSTNGIKLDGKRCEMIVLRDGAAVTLGDVTFDFQLSEEEREVLKGEKVLTDETVYLKEEGQPDDAEALAQGSAGPRRAEGEASSASGRGFMMGLGLLLFAILIFFMGLSIRHCKDTGRSLFKDMQMKTKTLKAKSEAQRPPASAAPSSAVVETPASADPVPAAPAVPADPAPAVPADPAPAVPADPAPAAPAVPADPAPAAPAAPADPAPAVPETPASAPGQ